jgi:hypothetical protein
VSDLIKCPDCGAEVSQFAEACLKCGRPIRGNVKVESAASAWWLALVLIAMVLATVHVVRRML